MRIESVNVVGAWPCRLGRRRSARGARTSALRRGRRRASSCSAFRTAPSPTAAGVRHSSVPGSPIRAGATPLTAPPTNAASDFTRCRRSKPARARPVRRRLRCGDGRDRGARAVRSLRWPISSASIPFELADANRPAYHAGAAIASQLSRHAPSRSARSLRGGGGAARGARAVDAADDRATASSSTGPIARGDWETVERHRRGDPRAPPRARAALRCACGGDERRDEVVAHDRRAARRSHRPDGRPSRSFRRWARSTRGTCR